MIFPIVGKTLVEVGVVFFGDFFWLSHPDGSDLVELFEFSGDFFDFLFFLVLLFVFLNLNVFLLFLFFLIVRNLLLSGLLNLQVNWESDEFGVLLN
jgi:hypothetical protein